jgi:hypothetical protein
MMLIRITVRNLRDLTGIWLVTAGSVVMTDRGKVMFAEAMMEAVSKARREQRRRRQQMMRETGRHN